MDSTIEQQVIETMRVLPEAKQKQILAYARQIREIEENAENQPKKRKLLEKLEELRAKLPDDAFEGLPTDGSLNHDYYLYGVPKRDEK